VIRPPGPKPDIYWDDSLLPNGMSVNLNGCNNIAGCHLWDIEVGDTSTLNSWWYVASTTAPMVSFMVKRAPGPPGAISGDPAFCSGATNKSYSVNPVSGATSYVWSYSGTGATIIANSTAANVEFTASATPGSLSVAGVNAECGNGPASSLPVSLYPPPQVNLIVPDTICKNEASFQLNGGSPTGGEYAIDSVVSADFDPESQGAGSHFLIYRYTDTHGCKNSDSATIFVMDGKECEIILWVPNAFTPNNDGLNDVFRPVSANIRDFTMNIYNRSGQWVFSSSRSSDGWDGTYEGQPCPDGNYVYIIVYESSLSPPQYTTITGNVMLVK